jgi:hypothetical protein
MPISASCCNGHALPLQSSLHPTIGHTPGAMHIPPATINVPGSKEFPFTLDLRRG